MEAGIELMRQNIKRSHPTLHHEQTEELLSSWLWRADDPIPGDIAGAVHVREMRGFNRLRNLVEAVMQAWHEFHVIPT
ncbi:MAG: hypothetical protein R6V06_02615 [Kiritimatiellia bacterium]